MEIKQQHIETDGTTLVIEADGGCVPNPGRKYGSYCITRPGVQEPVLEKVRVDMGEGTSNEAELDVLVMAVEDLLVHLVGQKQDPQFRSVVIYSDSENACKYLNRGTGACERLAQRAKRCVDGLSKFAIFHAHWRRRAHSVARFGH